MKGTGFYLAKRESVDITSSCLIDTNLFIRAHCQPETTQISQISSVIWAFSQSLGEYTETLSDY